jgi:hypothetical protein
MLYGFTVLSFMFKICIAFIFITIFYRFCSLGSVELYFYLLCRPLFHLLLSVRSTMWSLLFSIFVRKYSCFIVYRELCRCYM